MICKTVLIVVVVVCNISLTFNIVLPFKRCTTVTEHHHKHTPTSLLSELTDTSAGVSVCIGSGSKSDVQCLQLSLHMNEHATWVISSASTQTQHQHKGITTYNKTLSNTYQCVDPTLYYFSLLQYQNGYISKDMFSFTTTTTTYNDVIVIPKYNFLLCEQYNYIDNNSGVLGLASNTNAHHFLSHTNFLSQLNAYYNNTLPLQFSFIYDTTILSEGINDISTLTHGNVVIGDAHLYKGTYVNDNIIQNKNDKYIWGGYIKSITFHSSSNSSKARSNVVVNEQFEYELAFEFGYIFVPGRLHVKLLELFFNDMIHNNICNEVKFRTFYYGYICDSNKERDVINAFPQLHIHFNYGNIILNANDLFVKDTTTNSIICLLVFPSEEYGSGNGVNERWKLGAPFFKRQYMLFHYNNNTISYYISNSNSSNSVTTVKTVLMCVISIMCVICCILMLFVFKLFIYKYI